MLLLLLLAFFGSKDFLKKKKHMFGPDVFLIFVVIILFYFLPLFYFLSVGLKLYFSVQLFETAHLEMPLKHLQKEREHTLKKKRGCSRDNNPVKLNPVQTLNLMALFWLTLETRCRSRGVCCRQGKSEQMESWGTCRKTERIFWIAFASGVKLKAE